MTNEKGMIQDAIGILEYYEGEQEESLADESVISSLMDEYDLTIQDAHSILFKAAAIWEQSK